ncbi:unnamed protein product [Polarella glacialis]|uniref:Uncharacterized protein n=1 Tax=Polarella glacialis TaxID=89957 RepID=A0A813M0H9_POLGL|nr:unnamed protein product [Polarella glacialis]
MAVLTFCYTDLLGTTATFFAVAKCAGLTDSKGSLLAARQNMAYLADGLAAVVGSMLGVSTVETFGESMAGVQEGGKTGLTAVITGLCFLLALPFAPLASAVPPLASAPILCLLGAVMFGEGVRGVAWEDKEEALPAFLMVAVATLTFNLGAGIIAGLLLWLAIQTVLAPGRLRAGSSPCMRIKSLWNDATSESEYEKMPAKTPLPSEEPAEIRTVEPEVYGVI